MAKPPTKFIFTGHGVQRSKERQITEEQFMDCVISPTTRVQQRIGDSKGFVYRYTKRYQGWDLIVVAEVKKGLLPDHHRFLARN